MARAAIIRSLWGTERATDGIDVCGMDATNGFHGARFVTHPGGFGHESTHVRCKLAAVDERPTEWEPCDTRTVSFGAAAIAATHFMGGRQHLNAPQQHYAAFRRAILGYHLP